MHQVDPRHVLGCVARPRLYIDTGESRVKLRECVRVRTIKRYEVQSRVRHLGKPRIYFCRFQSSRRTKSADIGCFRGCSKNSFAISSSRLR